MSPTELAAIQSWVKERWPDDEHWPKTTPSVWNRVPAEAVWAVLVNSPADKAAPTPGETREATAGEQEPLQAGWPTWADHYGFPEGTSIREAGRLHHTTVLPAWTKECRCFPSGANKFAASEHIACHVTGCDLHAEERINA